MFAKHLPPSAGLPRVLALDERAAAELPAAIQALSSAAAESCDAVAGFVAEAFAAQPEAALRSTLVEWLRLLRPGGRLMLATSAMAAPPLEALTSAGYIHCLVEALPEGLVLYRGERPPTGSPVERVQTLAASAAAASPFLFLLIRQTPNRPAWQLTPDEPLTWHAVTVIGPGGAPVLLTFTSLVKAVAFLQPAVLAGFLHGVNKIGKFPAGSAPAWDLPCLVNPEFAEWQRAALGPAYAVDPQTALAGEG